MKRTTFACIILILASSLFAKLYAEVSLPSIFGDHMVLQQGQENPIWGWADPGEKIQVEIGSQSSKTTASESGSWKLNIKPLEAGGPYTLRIEAKNTIKITDILVGEVWICSGQSNMKWDLKKTQNAELEIVSANKPNIRLISIPNVGTQETQKDFEGQWELCSPETAANFSAVGYLFGNRLYQALDVPIGLIDNAWGGSTAEAWVRRDLLESEDFYKPLMKKWETTEKTYDHQKALDLRRAKLLDWEKSGKKGRKPRSPRNPLTGNHRPGNLFSGVLHPIIGYGIKGVVWYQGESNSKRAYQYRELFPLLIQNWRDAWQQGDFPFYYVQLADYQIQSTVPVDSSWAELREAQTMTMDRLPNVGQAVIIDSGEGRDIHPVEKYTVAQRLARWALARDYGLPLQYKSPRYRSMEISGNKALLYFDDVGNGLYAFDVKEPIGFAIAGDDRKFLWAHAKIIGKDTVEVWNENIPNPQAVRYAWADNPACNLYNREGLPLTPFRTDDWPGITANAAK